MIKAVLLDLDDTLLHVNDPVFVQEYLHLADTFFESYWHHPAISRTLIDIIRASSQPRDAYKTNTSLAIDMLAAATGRSLTEINDSFAVFYAEAYPALRQCVEPLPLAPFLLERLQDLGLAVVIATNPLYPAEAIRQRLGWAGLPQTFDSYALVTTADNMHFVKPDPCYYAEIVARVGIEPDEAIMVGDHLTNDIIAAATTRLHTYHINGNTSTCVADGCGTLDNFFTAVFSETWLERLHPRPLQKEAVEPQLWGNIGALFGMLADVQPRFWAQHPDPDEWSILQIVCHLLESESRVQRPRLKRILKEDNPFLANPPPPLGPREATACEQDGLLAAQRFAAERQETIAFLRAIPAGAWDRPARHSVFGLTTLLEMALFTAQHDRLHLNQLCRTLGRCE